VEEMQRKWRRHMLRAGKIVVVGMLSFAHSVLAMPNNETVVSGTANVVSNGSRMDIRQSSDKLIMNWQGFSIGSGEKVVFLQPSANSLSLNRVVGNNSSVIWGQLAANGRVFLVNPNGILFAPGS
jgi:filamentous hemagglutinin family protein